MISDELRYSVLRLLESNPDISQRDLAREVGVSLGKINYCLHALIAKGLVKARNFKNSKNKIAYTYYLTPKGVTEKVSMAYHFLSLKLREIEELRREIDRVREEHAAPRAALTGRESDA
jgi:EPS-associated MarR family transcriptional regulator